MPFLSDRTCSTCRWTFEHLAMSRAEQESGDVPCTACGGATERRIGTVAPSPVDSVVKRALTEEQADMAVTRQGHHMRRRRKPVAVW